MALNTDPLEKGKKVMRMASVDFISDSLYGHHRPVIKTKSGEISVQLLILFI